MTSSQSIYPHKILDIKNVVQIERVSCISPTSAYCKQAGNTRTSHPGMDPISASQIYALLSPRGCSDPSPTGSSTACQGSQDLIIDLEVFEGELHTLCTRVERVALQ
jgi:hypothetical protein